MRCLVSSILVLFVAPAAFANVADAVGPHHPIFRVEKNENPQNVMVVYVKTTEGCQLDRAFGLDYYWLMDGKRYKPVHAMLKKNIRKRIQLVSSDESRMVMRLKNVADFNETLENQKFDVSAKKVGGECVVTASALDMRLEKVFGLSRRTFLPPFRKIDSVSFSGERLVDGQNVERTYSRRSD